MNVELHELIEAVRGVRLDGSLSDDASVRVDRLCEREAAILEERLFSRIA